MHYESPTNKQLEKVSSVLSAPSSSSFSVDSSLLPSFHCNLFSEEADEMYKYDISDTELNNIDLSYLSDIFDNTCEQNLASLDSLSAVGNETIYNDNINVCDVSDEDLGRIDLHQFLDVGTSNHSKTVVESPNLSNSSAGERVNDTQSHTVASDTLRAAISNPVFNNCSINFTFNMFP